MLRARVCLWEEREVIWERETEGGGEKLTLPSKVCRKWMFGRKRQHGDLRQQRVSLCVILFGGPALNTQHKSAARARDLRSDHRRTHTVWGICDYLTLGWMCSCIGGRASFPIHGGWWRGITRALASQSRSARRLRPRAGPTNPGTRGGSPPEENSGDGRPSETHTPVKVSIRI